MNHPRPVDRGQCVPLAELELAKHWLFYTLLRLDLKPKSRFEDADGGLAFDFLADSPSPTGPKVLTGHDNGLITIAIEEADDAERERRRTLMHEPYRRYWDFGTRSAITFGTC